MVSLRDEWNTLGVLQKNFAAPLLSAEKPVIPTKPEARGGCRRSGVQGSNRAKPGAWRVADLHTEIMQKMLNSGHFVPKMRSFLEFAPLRSE